MNERIIKPDANQEDEALDTTLRPKALKDYVGQEKIKENLGVFITPANNPPQHF